MLYKYKKPDSSQLGYGFLVLFVPSYYLNQLVTYFILNVSFLYHLKWAVQDKEDLTSREKIKASTVQF